MDPKTTNILIAEPDAPTTAMLRRTLRSLGFVQINMTQDGYMTVLACKRSRVDLLIIDWDLPRLSGEEVLRYMRRIPHLRRPLTIMLINDAKRETLQKMAGLRIDDCLVKPLGPQMVAQKFMRLLGSKQAILSQSAASPSGGVAGTKTTSAQVHVWTPGKG